MRARTLQTWIARHIRVRRRLVSVCTSYLLFLMVVTTKHSLDEAARFSALHKSQFSKMLKSHGNVAVYTLENLSRKQAKQLAKARQSLKGLPWKIALINTLQRLKCCSNFGPTTIIYNKTIGYMDKGTERPGVTRHCSKTSYFTRHYRPHELTLRPSLLMIVYPRKSTYFREL